MSRLSRAHKPGTLSYVELVANTRREIFGDEADRLAFSQLIERYAERCHVQVHAYCWSEQTIRMVVRVTDIPLRSFISRIASQHAKRVNGRLGYRGNLFGGRYRQTLLEAPADLLNAVYRIHRAGLQDRATEHAAGDSWSSHGPYAGAMKPSWLTTDLVQRAVEAEYGAGGRGYGAFMGGRPPHTEDHIESASASSQALLTGPAATTSSQLAGAVPLTVSPFAMATRRRH